MFLWSLVGSRQSAVGTFVFAYSLFVAHSHRLRNYKLYLFQHYFFWLLSCFDSSLGTHDIFFFSSDLKKREDKFWMHARRTDAHGLSSSGFRFLARFLLHLHLDFDLHSEPGRFIIRNMRLYTFLWLLFYHYDHRACVYHPFPSTYAHSANKSEPMLLASTNVLTRPFRAGIFQFSFSGGVEHFSAPHISPQK